MNKPDSNKELLEECQDNYAGDGHFSCWHCKFCDFCFDLPKSIYVEDGYACRPKRYSDKQKKKLSAFINNKDKNA